MPVLSDKDLIECLHPESVRWPGPEFRLSIMPLMTPIQPASIDLRLGDHVLVPESGGKIDRYASRPQFVAHTQYPINEERGFLLFPEMFVNVATLERISIPSALVGIIVGKSTLARDGLQVEAAGYLDPGWDGCPTLELKNLGKNTIVLRREQPIAQLRVEVLTSRPSRLYGDPALGSHYQGARSVQAGFDSPWVAGE